MNIEIKIIGEMGSNDITIDVETPDNWTPSYNDLIKIRGAVIHAADGLIQTFSKQSSN